MKLVKFLIVGPLLVAAVFGIRNEIKQPHVLDTVYPFVVSLRTVTTTGQTYACGGAIISHDFVLTSADCLVDGLSVKLLYVIAGSVDLRAGGSIHIVTEKFVHADYKDGGWDNNIAILKVSPRFRVHVGEHIAHVRLESQQPRVGTKVSLPGWGSVQVNDNVHTYPDTLQHVELKTISNAVCNEYNLNVTDKQMCTLTHIGQGACIGDQGFPLVVMDTVKKVVAITTSGYSCGSGFPDVYTKVSPFMRWINATCNCIFDPVF